MRLSLEAAGKLAGKSGGKTHALQLCATFVRLKRVGENLQQLLWGKRKGKGKGERECQRGMQHKVLAAHKTLRNKRTKIERTSKLQAGEGGKKQRATHSSREQSGGKDFTRIDFVRLLKAQTRRGQCELRVCEYVCTTVCVCGKCKCRAEFCANK